MGCFECRKDRLDVCILPYSRKNKPKPRTKPIKSILLATILLLSSVTFAGPSCIWDLESTDVKNINGNQLSIERYDCRNKDYWKYEVIKDVFKASVVNTKNETIIIEDSDNYEIIELMSNAPINAIYFSYPGASNVGSSVRVYDKNWKHTETLNSPVNEYQASNRKGPESKIIGFFKIDNNWYIENIRSLGGDCNACMRYVIDTYKVLDGGLVVVDTRDPDWDDYQRYMIIK
jgi:hypothetical protein